MELNEEDPDQVRIKNYVIDPAHMQGPGEWRQQAISNGSVRAQRVAPVRLRIAAKRSARAALSFAVPRTHPAASPCSAAALESRLTALCLEFLERLRRNDDRDHRPLFKVHVCASPRPVPVPETKVTL